MLLDAELHGSLPDGMSGGFSSCAAPRLSLDRALPTCEYYPVGLDLAAHTIAFARVGRETYRAAAFLTPRLADMGRKQFTFNIDDLLLEPPPAEGSGGRLHFILISAFCCSTLLARCLDEVPGFLVLREPALIGQLAYAHRGFAQGAPAEQPAAEWRDAARLSLALLCRAFAPGETVVAKASDVPNCIARDLAELSPRSKFVLLSVGLRTFILSVLKSPSRRRWMRGRAPFLRRAAGGWGPLAAIDPRPFDDARLSAFHWLVTQAFWRDLRAIVPDRLLAIEGGEVPAAPAMVVERVARFFGVAANAAEIDRIAAAPTLARHAKHKRRAYDAGRRRADLAAWDALFGRDADRAVAWAEPLAEALGAALSTSEVA